MIRLRRLKLLNFTPSSSWVGKQIQITFPVILDINLIEKNVDEFQNR